MTKNEKKAVVRLVRHMQQLQRMVKKPTREDATPQEVRMLFRMLWQWTPTPNQKLPSKHVIENLIGLLRGCEPREYCYISLKEVACIIRMAAQNNLGNRQLQVLLSKGWEDMTDEELYHEGFWNYKPTPLVALLTGMHCNPQKIEE